MSDIPPADDNGRWNWELGENTNSHKDVYSYDEIPEEENEQEYDNPTSIVKNLWEGWDSLLEGKPETVRLNEKFVRHSFSYADMREANFSGADLRDARFTYIDARGANFAGANLSGAVFLYSTFDKPLEEQASETVEEHA